MKMKKFWFLLVILIFFTINLMGEVMTVRPIPPGLRGKKVLPSKYVCIKNYYPVENELLVEFNYTSKADCCNAYIGKGILTLYRSRNYNFWVLKIGESAFYKPLQKRTVAAVEEKIDYLVKEKEAEKRRKRKEKEVKQVTRFLRNLYLSEKKNVRYKDRHQADLARECIDTCLLDGKDSLSCQLCVLTGGYYIYKKNKN